MKLDAEFLRSSSKLGIYPDWERVEIAFAGRSNVGKSSLLNALVQIPGLARMSRTPGRTRAINFFSMGSKIALVDLPGYGFAKMSRAEAGRLGLLVDDYLARRISLAALVLLIDERRGPEEEELMLLKLAEDRAGGPLSVIVAATKCDKVRPSQHDAAMNRFAADGIDPIRCSARTSQGVALLRQRILACAEQRLATSDAAHRF
jgi:GTP-binding protein